MLDKLLLHDQTRRAINAMQSNIPHGLLLVGAHGSGKSNLALILAADTLGKQTVEDLLKDAYFSLVEPIKGSIGIEAIRELQKFMTLKTTGTGAIRRAVVVTDAEGMTTEAQNAFLKLLEEPPVDTLIIMTVDHKQHLLPTVNSRLQALDVLPPSKADTLGFFKDIGTSAEIERAYLISQGRPGLMHAILSGDTEHPLVEQINKAKVVYGQKIFDRLCSVEELSKQKETLPELFAGLKRIAKTAMDQAAAKGEKPTVEQWRRRLSVIHQAEADLQRNANPKLLLTDLFLNL